MHSLSTFFYIVTRLVAILNFKNYEFHTKPKLLPIQERERKAHFSYLNETIK